MPARTRAGIALATLSNMLRDKHEARPENVAAGAGALGVPVAALENDAACFVELGRLAGVPDVRVGSPPTLQGDLAALLASVPVAQREGLITMFRGMVQSFVGRLPPAPATVEPEREDRESRQREPSPGRQPPADEGAAKR